MKDNKISVCVVLINDKGQVLTVSRKNNPKDFGLVGGKMESTDSSIIHTAIRETKEETGLDLIDLNLLDIRYFDGFQVYLFVSDFIGELKTDEPHFLKWSTFESTFNGTFGDYNKAIHREFFSHIK